MPGAIMRIDQVRPGPVTSSGTPGVARKDIWRGNLVQLVSTLSGNSAQQWTLLDRPAASTATLTNDDQITCTFTPDVVGTYRIRLVTNNGGAGNQQTLVIGVSKDESGATIFRGWRIPSFGERSGESNWPGNLRGWAEALEALLIDINTAIQSTAVADASTTVKGIVKLAGDLRGTALLPLVQRLTGGTDNILRIVAPEIQNESTSKGRTNAKEVQLQTTDNSSHTLLAVDVSAVPDALITIDVVVEGILADGSVGHWWKKSRAWLNTAGVLTQGTQRDIDDEQIGVAPPGTWLVTLTDDAAQELRVQVFSDNDDVTWYLVSQSVRISPVT